ncbi:hypothetical protein C3E79_08890 [Corynebacterium liangguodongii]|uniref:peptidyl-tRNA hydrolase n=2 Tax=Corynebacterium liangguodongii TaxID=2079535 RepID=A0A2S0WH80_9CORY|nr:hypothetical protein C3E79_08890 [Corynebacterium liangguodongii]PWB98903.1 hypothetical protein DF219_09495 [Corynebacterium liangguodongii]
MPIVLNLPKGEAGARLAREDVLADAARAVVMLCLDPRAGQEGELRDGLARWYSGRIRKLARRCRGSAWEAVQELPGVTCGHARAFVPCAVSRPPRQIAKLQISGTDLPAGREPEPLRASAPVVAVNGELGMTLGKAAAQVGHASMLLAAHRPLAWVRAWAEQGFPLGVREVDGARFAALATSPGAVPVIDAGFTEVAPGSTTVVALQGAG